MLDFKKKMTKKSEDKTFNPIDLYETLDRAYDKGPLRSIQSFILKKWFEEYRTEKDVLIKLHTGQGKTLVGLLTLYSRLREYGKPVLYICPNNYLVEQTVDQGKKFGLKTVQIDGDLPDEFINGKCIGVANVHKLFNGLTKFGTGRNYVEIDSIVIDDAHACSDTIREIFRITINREESCYDQIFKLFSSDIEKQGVGTFADIENSKQDAFLPIPYWAWIDKESEVAGILSKNTDKKSIKYSWPLLKNSLKDCVCIVSGKQIQIEPYFPKIDLIKSYYNAAHRVFMSATVTDDSFLIKGLQISKRAITMPLIKPDDKWSGEKLLLIPSVIHEDLNRTEIVNYFGKPSKERKFGVFVLSPSFNKTLDWKSLGSVICTTEDVKQRIESASKGAYSETVVVVNRYDGIDLPDDVCRLLIIDRLPYSENYIDLYFESCRPDCAEIIMRHARKIEQGAGRSVRGEKDYSVILVIGEDLVRILRDSKTQMHFSNQMKKQVEIGLEVSKMAFEEINSEKNPFVILNETIKQCLTRDEGWKEYYVDQMGGIEEEVINGSLLSIFEAELNAQKQFELGEIEKVNQLYQQIIDEMCDNESEKAWYTQELARRNYLVRRDYSERLQMSAFRRNRSLLKPHEGVQATRIQIINKNRIEKIHDWIRQFDNYSQLSTRISDILAALSFGVDSERFENALNELGISLGFDCERPDKEWKEGPDNLWAIESGKYIVWECKNEVNENRTEIYKYEADQMNTSYAWFTKTYDNSKCKCIMIHPSNYVASSASFLKPVGIIGDSRLRKLKDNVRLFFKEFENQNYNDLNDRFMQSILQSHNLSTKTFWSDEFCQLPKQKKA